nr:MAG TPA: hypothetical protein [Bacteriophage sp.]
MSKVGGITRTKKEKVGGITRATKNENGIDFPFVDSKVQRNDVETMFSLKLERVSIAISALATDTETRHNVIEQLRFDGVEVEETENLLPFILKLPDVYRERLEDFQNIPFSEIVECMDMFRKMEN